MTYVEHRQIVFAMRSIGYYALAYLCFKLSFIISFYQLLVNKD